MVLYELLTRRVPYHDLQDEQLMKAGCMDDKRPKLEHIEPDQFPLDVIQLMQQCWAKERTQRPDFEEIERCLKDHAPSHSEEQERALKDLADRVLASVQNAKMKLDRVWDLSAQQGGDMLLRLAHKLAALFPDDDDNPPRQPNTAADVDELYEVAQDNALVLLRAMQSFADALGGVSVRVN